MQHVTQQLFSLSTLFSLFVPEKASRGQQLHLLYIYAVSHLRLRADIHEGVHTLSGLSEGVKRTMGGIIRVVFRLTAYGAKKMFPLILFVYSVEGLCSHCILKSNQTNVLA